MPTVQETIQILFRYVSPLPPEHWHMVYMDFCSAFPTGEDPFVVTDGYSRFSEADIVYSTSPSAIIPRIDKIFSPHGISLTVRSDNAMATIYQ